MGEGEADPQGQLQTLARLHHLSIRAQRLHQHCLLSPRSSPAPLRSGLCCSARSLQADADPQRDHVLHSVLLPLVLTLFYLFFL